VNTIVDSVQHEDPKRASPVRVERTYIKDRPKVDRVFKKEASPPTKETDQHSEAKPYETKHSLVYSRTMVRSHQAMLLISRPTGVGTTL